MQVLVEGRLVGVFGGYLPGRIYRLDDGEEWEQVGNVVEHVYRKGPTCRIVSDGQRTYLDVEGTSDVAEVRRYLGRRWAGPGAY